jgi:hypothetical protein
MAVLLSKLLRLLQSGGLGDDSARFVEGRVYQNPKTVVQIDPAVPL